MRFVRILVPVLAAFLLSACLTIEEKLSLRKDGSGSYSTMVDLGEMLSNSFVKMAMQEEMKKENPDMAEMRVDSAINLFETLAPANPQWSEADKKLIRSIDSRITMDMEKGEGAFVTSFPFASFDQLERTMQLMAEAKQPDKEGEEESDSPFGSAGMISNAINDFTWKKGRLQRQSSPGEQMRGMLGEDETMEMARMMFSESKVVYSMEMPGKIKKVKGFPGHEIVDENTIQLSFNFLDFLDNPEKIDEAMDGEIKYK